MPINPIPRTESKENYNKKDKEMVHFEPVEPEFTFNDIVLSDDILCEIESLITLEINKDLIFDKWGLSEVIKRQKGMSVNLYGKPGTGKTMTAHAIANKLKKKIIVVNYAEIESKYVGETSKNLVLLFEEAEKQNAVILFDEADALLSKRVTAMHSAADVSVNQTRNVLLKLLDEYDGVIVFTTNFINNYDQAFFRRIRSHIKFELPNQEMRRRLWMHYLVDKLPISGDKNQIAKELCIIDSVTGSDIANAVLRATTLAVQNARNEICLDDLRLAINKCINVKNAVDDTEFRVSSRKVSGEYVKNIFDNGGMLNGNI